MAGKTRPSLMAKTLTNVALSNLSLTDKKCIEEVFKKFREIKQLTPCDVCAYDPPSSCDGKPCTICPAMAKMDSQL